MHHFLSQVTIWSAAAIAAIIFAAASVGFLGAALYLSLVPIMVPPFAALVVGLVGLALAGLIILVARMISRRSPAALGTGAADPSRAGDVNDIAAALGGLAARELTSRTQAHPYRAFAVALGAGLAVGISPELRDILKGALKK
jgi:xanthosine utilization system XapX-like protein